MNRNSSALYLLCTLMLLANGFLVGFWLIDGNALFATLAFVLVFLSALCLKTIEERAE